MDKELNDCTRSVVARKIVLGIPLTQDQRHFLAQAVGWMELNLPTHLMEDYCGIDKKTSCDISSETTED